ncbi:glycosyltransferase [Pseudonocardia lacus]|uniref:glycosyltransferase n=1 Tax=Pseudonocardia lacus TaxID=2835865 RepID=UPI001BDDB6EC|nr:glycosyltransferase [Pseudonocardia lacus]
MTNTGNPGLPAPPRDRERPAGGARRRIVHIFGAMDRGGAELRTLEAVEHLGRTEFDTVYLTLSGRAGELAGRIRASGDSVIPLRLDVRFPFRFVRLLRADRIDVVHSHVATFSGAVLALARLGGVRRRIAHFRSDGDQRADTVARRFQRSIMRALLSWSATDILGVSPSALDQGWRARWRADPRCRILPNGLDIHRIPPTDDRAAMRDELGIAPDTPVICHVGRPAAVKNRGRAVDLGCHPLLAERAAVLVMVGSLADGEAEKWRARADRQSGTGALRMLGTRPDVLRILNAADLTLVTSTCEGLPGVVLESLAVGTPVVASDLPGARWIGELVPGVHIHRLDEPDEVWARSILAGLDAAGPAERARLRRSFAAGPFLLPRVSAELRALWHR